MDVGDVLLQPASISVQICVETAPQGSKQCDLELSLKPIEIVYRHRTVSNIASLVTMLGQVEEGAATNPEKEEVQDDNNIQIRSASGSLSSLTLTVPVLQERDFSGLYRRCGHYVRTCSTNRSAVGLVLDQLSFEHKRQEEETDSGTETTTSVDCHNAVIFASTPDSPGSPLERRSRRLDIFAATGRFEVDPFIPIAVEYRQNIRRDGESNFSREAFPEVPAFSSFKARQEDEEEDDEIDRILSEKLNNVSVDGRRALRAQDPQSKMLSEAGSCESVIMIHIPEIAADLSKDELVGFLEMIECCTPRKEDRKSAASPSTPGSCTSRSRSVAISVACDALSMSIHNNETGPSGTMWHSHLLRLDRFRAYTITGGTFTKLFRVLSHETTFFEGKSEKMYSGFWFYAVDD